jgi:hypothetical protein
MQADRVLARRRGLKGRYGAVAPELADIGLERRRTDSDGE